MNTKTIPNTTLGTFREENQASKLLRHASIQMTERYTHLAPHHLHDAVANLEYQHVFNALKTKRTVLYQNDLNTSVKWSG